MITDKFNLPWRVVHFSYTNDWAVLDAKNYAIVMRTPHEYLARFIAASPQMYMALKSVVNDAQYANAFNDIDYIDMGNVDYAVDALALVDARETE